MKPCYFKTGDEVSLFKFRCVQSCPSQIAKTGKVLKTQLLPEGWLVTVSVGTNGAMILHEQYLRPSKFVRRINRKIM